MSGTTTLVWFRRDLRLADNPALAAAVADSDRVVAVYVHAPDDESAVVAGCRERAGGCTTAWRRSTPALRQQGIALTLRRGPGAVRADRTGARGGRHEGRLEPSLRPRHGRARHGGQGRTARARLRVRRATTRTCCTSRGRSAPGRAGRTASSRRSGAPASCDSTRSRRRCRHRARLRGPSQPLDSLALARARPAAGDSWDAAFCARTGHPGEAGAQRRLEEFCGEWLGRYDDGRNRPDLPGTSRLSPHLHFGEISPRQCLVAARNAVVDQPAGARSRPTVSCARSAGASSRTTCCITFRTRPSIRSTSASSASRGRENPALLAGLAARPHRLSRSSTPACASCGRPAGCTTACA